MVDYPGRLTYHNILVVPYESLYGNALHQGGPLWPDWETPSPARFFRESGPVDDRPSEVPTESQINTSNAFWIGPLYKHFGHMMLEFAPRIAPSVLADPSAELIFATYPGGPRTLAEAPTWLRDLLSWHGVTPERVRVIDHPIRFASLNVVPMPERAGFEDPPPPHAAHLDALTDRTRHNLGEMRAQGVLVVSRSRFRDGLVGEAYLDEVFTRAGAKVIHPETMPFWDQLRSYAAHETLIFSEGSAFHGFQQLGRYPGDGAILKRRPDVNFGHVVGPPRFRRFELLETTRARVIERKPNGLLNIAGGLSFIDVPKLLEGAASFGIDLWSHWDESEFRRAESIHVLNWAVRQGLRSACRHPAQLPELVAAFHQARLPGVLGLTVQVTNNATRLFVR